MVGIGDVDIATVGNDLYYSEKMNNARAIAQSDNIGITDFEQVTGYLSGKYALVSFPVSRGDYGTLTGFFYQKDDKGVYMFQLNNGEYLVWKEADENGIRFVENTTKIHKSIEDAQKVIDKLIDNNKHIISNNLLCARFAAKLTQAEKRELYELQSRLEQRNQALQDADYIQSATTSTPAGYSQLQAYLTQFMESEGVGSVTAAIVIAVVLIAATSTAAYFAYKCYYNESEQDVKFSDDLTKILMAKLTPEEYEQLKRETQGIVTKASLKARLKGNLSWLAIAALAVGGLLLIKKAR